MPATISLTLSSNLDELAHSVVLPWLRLRTLLAWQSPKPTVMLVPTRAETFYWKEKLAAAGTPLLGILFWTPSDARTFLIGRGQRGQREIGSPADLVLLARQAAMTLLASQQAPDLIQARFLQAVQISPAGFLAQFEMLTAAGWAPGEHGSDMERLLAEEFTFHLNRLNLQTQPQAHRELRQALEATSGDETQVGIADLLIAGFNASHWPIWDLLAACSLAAAQCTVALSAPTSFAQVPDQTWITAWENWAGTSFETPTNPAEFEAEITDQAPFAKLAGSFESGTSTPAPPNNSLTLMVGPDLPTHARAIVTQTLLWLAREDCTRIGLIFPNAGPLSLAVAEQLRDLNIPHNDGTGFLRASTFSEPSWLTWLDLQENPSSANFLAWYLACQNELRRETGAPKRPAHDPDSLELGLRMGEPFSPATMDEEREPTANEVAHALNRALDRVLIDSLPVLQSFLAESKNPRELRLVEILNTCVQLPPEAPLRNYLELTYAALNLQEALEKCLPEWVARRLATPSTDTEPNLSLASYLKWLRAITDRRTRQRDSSGNDYYGKVHLAIAAQMTGQSWSHLLLADMNRNVWPKEPDPAPFLSSQALEKLNKTARRLNRDRPESDVGHGYCLAPLDRPELNFRDLCHALENTSAALCLTASLKHGNRVSAPNELFSHAYQVLHGTALSDVQFQAMAGEIGQVWGSRRMAIWESEAPPKQIAIRPEAKGPILGQDIDATAFAFRTRRDPTQPCGPFQFCFQAPPENPIQMSCREWDDTLLHPTKGWLDQVVGCEPSPTISAQWRKTVGIWLHEWTARSIRSFRDSADFPAQPPEDVSQYIVEILLREIDSAKEKELQKVQNWCQLAGMLLPHWWTQVRSQAVAQTEQLLVSLAPDLRDWEPYPECPFQKGILAVTRPLAMPSLELFGRMDCLMVRRESPLFSTPAPAADVAPAGQKFRLPDLARRSVWVIDFKTGPSSKLSVKTLSDPIRKGWQPVLYGWALSHLQAQPIKVSLLHPGERDPVLKLEDVLSEPNLFKRLDLMHRHGVFGQPPTGSDEFGFNPDLPIATLPISKSILGAKWDLALVEYDGNEGHSS